MISLFALFSLPVIAQTPEKPSESDTPCGLSSQMLPALQSSGFSPVWSGQDAEGNFLMLFQQDNKEWLFTVSNEENNTLLTCILGRGHNSLLTPPKT